MKIIIIGHINTVHRQFEESQTVQTFGGTFSSIAAMAGIASNEDTIIPVFSVGHDEYDDVLKECAQFSNIETKGISLHHGKTDALLLDGKSGKILQNSLAMVPAVSFGELEPHLKSADAVYVNMQSGFDITLDTLDHIRLEIRSRRIPLYLDLHNLTLGFNPDGSRFRRSMSDWRRWCFMTNFVQLSEEEAAGISIEGFTNELLAKQMMPLMVKALFITRPNGSVTLFRDAHKSLVQNEISAAESDAAILPTDAGNIFGALFFYFYTKTKNILQSAETAVKIMTASAKYCEPDKFVRLKELAV
ncbi:MAG: carbohydrate kinase family protein [Bacteroidetes bacterium]|nr:carbohydrate kinase family protein [Bacteroidota bacterium]